VGTARAGGTPVPCSVLCMIGRDEEGRRGGRDRLPARILPADRPAADRVSLRDAAAGRSPSGGTRRAGVRAAVPAWPRHPLAVSACCLAALAVIGLLDATMSLRRWPVPVVGALDEPAHLMTAGLLIAAFLPWRARTVVPWMLAGSVLIDLDHIPFYLWNALAIDGAGRPVTHSLALVLLLALLGAAASRLRRALLGLAAGVAMHLFRDLGTGPGVPLWWPLGWGSQQIPYAVYLGLLAGVTVVALDRQRRRAH
jgi:inner membrane protein